MTTRSEELAAFGPALGLVAALLLTALAFAAAVAAVVAGILGGGVPDPFAPDGDPCCRYPDTWSDTVVPALLVAGALALMVALVVGAAALAGWRWPGRRRFARRLALWSGGTAALVLGAYGLFVVVHLDDAYTRADCDTFRFDPAQWRSSSAADRMRAADGLDRCGALNGRPTADVVRLLGLGIDHRAHDAEYDLHAPAHDGGGRYVLSLTFERGRLTSAAIETGYESD